MIYKLITTNQDLKQYCQSLLNAKHLSIDTEFIRTKTFYPHLGLLQLFDGEQVVLIDPLLITDWNDFIALFLRSDREFYFHACSEDLEVFQYHFNLIPTPILDSQILASFLDNPLSSGYATLVNKYLNIELDKSETRTDWLKRPLTSKQLHYAANDVYYLTPLIEKLKSLVFDKGWLNAAYSECEQMVKKKSVVVQPENAYLLIKNAWQLKGNELYCLKNLAEWRMMYAKEHDIALNFVIHEEVLWKLAKYQPRTFAEMSSLGLRGHEIRLFGEIIKEILTLPKQNIDPIKRVVNYTDYKYWSNLIRNVSEDISKETNLNKELLISKRQIDQFVRWKHNEIKDLPELLSGWRKELFENYLN
ncbi:ribonuclease D [Orbaceae bacterium ac157xtp]